MCLRLTRDVTAAEDCTEETDLHTWRMQPAFEGRRQLTTRLHRIAVNVVIERRRRSGTAPAGARSGERQLRGLDLR